MRALLALLVTVAVAGAAVTQVPTLDYNTVNSYYSAASAGDVLILPSGTATWTSTLTCNKDVDIVGQGKESTVIINNKSAPVGGSAGIYSFSFNVPSNEIVRLAHLQVEGVNQWQDGVAVRGTGGAGWPETNAVVCIDHCKFEWLRWPVRFESYAYGVLWSNEVLNCERFARFLFGNSTAWNKSWALEGTNTWGTTQACIIEDSYMRCNIDPGAWRVHLLHDAGQGGRGVIRFSRYTNTSLNWSSSVTLQDTHGQQADGQKGTTAFEYYGNIYHSARKLQGQDWRGGAMIMCSNEFITEGRWLNNQWRVDDRFTDKEHKHMGFFWENYVTENGVRRYDIRAPARSSSTGAELYPGTDFWRTDPATNKARTWAPLAYPHPIRALYPADYIPATDGGQSTPVPVGPAGYVEFAATNYLMTEGWASVTAIVQRINGSEGAATVSVVCAEMVVQDAIIDTDFPAATVDVTWADEEDGEKTAIFVVTDDADSADDETFLLFLTNAATAIIAEADEAQVQILCDDDAGQLLWVNAAPPELWEGYSTNIYITRTNGMSGVASVDIIDTWAATNGMLATPGYDYAAVSGTATWADNEYGSKLIYTLIASNNMALETLNEAFIFQQDNEVGAAWSGSTTWGGFIWDADDVGWYGFLSDVSAYDYTSAYRHSGSVDNDIEITVGCYSFGDPPTFARTIGWRTEDGAAKSNTHYVGTNGTITWAAGDTNPVLLKIDILAKPTKVAELGFMVQLTNIYSLYPTNWGAAYATNLLWGYKDNQVVPGRAVCLIPL